MTDYAIEVNGLTKLVRDSDKKQKILLNNICFRVAKSSVCGLVGHNGAGKTTLIKAMLGLTSFDSGSIQLVGQKVYHKSVLAKIGYLPERPYFHDFLTGQEFLSFHYSLVKGRKPHNTEVANAIGMVGLAAEVLQKNLGLYSKGMLQRIGLAQALIHGPEIIILDEPLSGLDPKGRDEIRQLIGAIASSRSKTIILTSHVIEDLDYLCDQVLILNKGCLERDIDLKRLSHEKILIDIIYDVGNKKLQSTTCESLALQENLNEIGRSGFKVVDIKKQSVLRNITTQLGLEVES